MEDSPFEMRFDPKTIKHLGVRMYSTLPPAIAELIANAYDADATEVVVGLTEQNGKPIEISVYDDGHGLTREEINKKFLVIGRNRREEDGDVPSQRFARKPIGKKGLGKLALFGLATEIVIDTRRDGCKNVFSMNWENLIHASGSYRPDAVVINQPTSEPNGTTIHLRGLKRKSAFDATKLADSISRLFIVDDNFSIIVRETNGDRIAVDNKRRYRSLSIEFEWDLTDTLLVPSESDYSGKLSGKLITTERPIAPSSDLRGITLFSRQKLVNAAEFFSASTSSHFYQYLTGWINVDFVDDLEEDVISTNRQSLDWDHPEMSRLRTFLSGIVAQVNSEWRRLRKEKKGQELQETTGIDTKKWLESMPEEIRSSAEQIVDTLSGEDALERYQPVIKALHNIVPEYPLLHWRHLHDKIKARVEIYYRNQQYGIAASEGAKIFCEVIRNLTSLKEDGQKLVNQVFGSAPFATLPLIQLNKLTTESDRNIQEGQGHLSRGLIAGFRNPISHDPMDSTVPAVFSELDCLNILSLISYLVARMDGATVNPRK